ncbi:NAD dependent epimerase/dehydratase family protein [Thermoplasmatales archaeon SCGC AB-540-F20]|nr:NAD dependent epimerase/dehydratase family protein [Thermoplasmatales archaeon SCGC AB-540-F20]
MFGDGNQTRDFTFVRDTVDANILAMESNASGVFNIAGGKRISINELAQLVMRIIGRELDVVHNDPQPGDVRNSLADISKAKEKLGYEPRFDLTKGLEETLTWFRK